MIGLLLLCLAPRLSMRQRGVRYPTARGPLPADPSQAPRQRPRLCIPSHLYALLRGRRLAPVAGTSPRLAQGRRARGRRDRLPPRPRPSRRREQPSIRWGGSSAAQCCAKASKPCAASASSTTSPPNKEPSSKARSTATRDFTPATFDPDPQQHRIPRPPRLVHHVRRRPPSLRLLQPEDQGHSRRHGRGAPGVFPHQGAAAVVDSLSTYSRCAKTASLEF